MAGRKTLIALLCAAFFAGNAASEQAQKPSAPAVTVHFDYCSRDRAQVHVLEHRLENAIRRAGAGELGQTEVHVDGNDGYFYMYGPDADRLYEVAAPILKSSRLTAHAEITKRHGSGTERM